MRLFGLTVTKEPVNCVSPTCRISSLENPLGNEPVIACPPISNHVSAAMLPILEGIAPVNALYDMSNTVQDVSALKELSSIVPLNWFRCICSSTSFVSFETVPEVIEPVNKLLFSRK